MPLAERFIFIFFEMNTPSVVVPLFVWVDEMAVTR